MSESHPRYHGEHLLEAQESQRRPFQASAFGRLPAEVRNLIYDHVMTFESPEKDRAPYWLLEPPTSGTLQASLPSSAGSPPRGTRPRLALLCVCKRVYEEAHGLCYTPEYFCFSNAKSMLGLLFEAGWARRPDMQVVWILLGGFWNSRLRGRGEAKALLEALGCLVHCKSLRRLNIYLENSWQLDLHSDLIQPLQGLQNVEIVVGCYTPERWDCLEGVVDIWGEVHQWRLVRNDAGTSFEVKDGDPIDLERDFWSQGASENTPRSPIWPKLRERWNLESTENGIQARMRCSCGQCSYENVVRMSRSSIPQPINWTAY